MDPKAQLPSFAKFVPRRRQKIPRDNIMGITRPAIRRLARRGGIIRVKKEIYNEIRLVIKDRLQETLKQVVLVVESSGPTKNPRKIVTTRDVVFALNRMGHTLYGFGHL